MQKDDTVIYVRYFWAVLRHKWFVFVECCKLGIPWLGVIHDLSKFLPSEFVPYARYFYGGDRSTAEATEWSRAFAKEAFDMAWLHHQHRNKHHWQRWLMTLDSARSDGKMLAFPMPDRYRKEMLADWRGAGRAHGNPNTKEWYEQHREQIRLDPVTRKWIEERL